MDALDHECAVAVVGMGCRFPHAASVDQYWQNLTSNTDSVTPVPPDRFDIDAYYSDVPQTPGRTISRFGGFLDDPFAFDPAFFGIAPSEAATLDPQHRLLLTVAWEALEDAGIVPSSLAGSRTGVFTGQATAEYARHGDAEQHTLREVTGSHLRSMATGRISYALDLRGPSLLVDTACSSSLVAVHAARRSLLSGDCDLAVAGGVNVILSPYDAVAYSQAAMLAPDGHCKFGAEDGDGFVRSEGVGAVLLKRLVDAERDGDRVLAVLLGSAVVNDGRGSGLLLKPAVSGQVDMVRTACRDAGIEPADLDYVEAHGTGTAVGDSVELTALADAVRDGRTSARPLLTGSVKSNIGHTEAAAGIAGLIKAILVVRHGTIPASLHAARPHPLLTRDDVPVRVVTANAQLQPAGDRAVVGVSSFGLSGTNAHVVVGAYTGPDAEVADDPAPAPDDAAPSTGSRTHLLVLSARSRRSLTALASAYADFLEPGGAGRAHPPQDVCAAAALRREAHPYRLWVTGADHDALAAGLRAVAQGHETESAGTDEAGFGPARRTVFVFPGQGAQWAGMGRGLLASSAAFRRTLKECDAAVRAETGWSVIDVLSASDVAFPSNVSTVQPVLWAVQTALAAHWQSMGVAPDACVGHSMGEAAAAGVSGALSLSDAAAVICRRSRLMGELAGRGGMLVTELSPDAARDLARDKGPGVCVAAENSSDSTVLSGDRATLERVADTLSEQGVFHRMVPVDVASHAPTMDVLRSPLSAALADLRPLPPRVPMHSSVLCRMIEGPELDAAYWMSNVREPVRFRESIRHLAKEADSVFVEISPHPVLSAAVSATLDDLGAVGAVVGSTRRQQDEQTALTRALGRTFAHGGQVDWERWFGGPAPHIPLPAYQWDEQRLRTGAAGPAEASRPERTGQGEPTGYTQDFPQDDRVTGVRVRGIAPIPPVVHLAVLHDAARAAGGHEDIVLEGARVGDTWPEIPAGRTVILRAALDGAMDEEGCTASVRPLPDGTGALPAQPCLTASVRRSGHTPTHVDVRPAMARCRSHWSGPEFLRRIEKRGYGVAPAFRAVQALWRRDGEVVALLRRPEVPRHAVWEACLLPLLAAFPAEATYRPAAFGHTRFLSGLPEYFWVHATVSTGSTATADVTVAAADGRMVAALHGITLHHGPADVPAPGPLPAPGSFPSGLAGLVPGVAGGAMRAAVSSPRSVGARLANILTSSLQSALRIAPGGPGQPDPEPTARNTEGTPLPPNAPGATVHSVPEQAAPIGPAAGDEPLDAVKPTVNEAIVRSAARLLGMAPEQIDERRPLRDYGFDSLMALQLRRELRGLGIEIPLGRLVGPESPLQLAA